MVTLQVGIFPGKIDTFVVAEGTSVKEVLAMAGISQAEDQEIKVDGEVVNDSYTISEGDRLVLLSKRLKGAR